MQDCSEALRYDRKNAIAFSNRGVAHAAEGNPTAQCRTTTRLYGWTLSHQRPVQPRRRPRTNSTGTSCSPIMMRLFRTQVADARAWNRCWMRAIVGRLQSALADFNESLRLNPNSANALDSRGLIHLKLDELDLSIGDYDAALDINPQLTLDCMVWGGKAKQG
jgi:tetratricopeptide (TPR) repeat protein